MLMTTALLNAGMMKMCIRDRSSSYELMHEKDFPALRIGNRIVVPKEAFIRWVEQHTGGAE